MDDRKSRSPSIPKRLEAGDLVVVWGRVYIVKQVSEDVDDTLLVELVANGEQP